MATMISLAKASFSKKTASVTTGWPLVNVPVLSKAMAFKCANCSKATPLFNKIPLRALLEIAAKVAGVAEATKAQGDATTNMTMPR